MANFLYKSLKRSPSFYVPVRRNYLVVWSHCLSTRNFCDYNGCFDGIHVYEYIAFSVLKRIFALSFVLIVITITRVVGTAKHLDLTIYISLIETEVFFTQRTGIESDLWPFFLYLYPTKVSTVWYVCCLLVVLAVWYDSGSRFSLDLCIPISVIHIICT